MVSSFRVNSGRMPWGPGSSLMREYWAQQTKKKNIIDIIIILFKDIGSPRLRWSQPPGCGGDPGILGRLPGSFGKCGMKGVSSPLSGLSALKGWG